MGGLSKGYDPGTIVLVDMTADKTWGRRNTIFGDGIAGHCARPNAVCPRLHAFLLERAQRLGVPHQRCGKLVVINGPRFSSIPESENNRTDSYDVVGMNTEPEAGLARELCMCYVVIGQTTDLDNPPHAIMAGVDQPVISGALPRVGKLASRLILETLRDAHMLPEWEEYMSCKCKDVLRGAILTDPRGVSPIARDRLCHIFGIKEIPSEWFAR